MCVWITSLSTTIIPTLQQAMATVADPSTPGRTVPQKKANVPFTKHQKELEKRAKDAAAAPPKQRGLLAILVKWAFVAALVAVGTGMFVTGDPIYGYRGKLVQKEFWFPVSAATAFGLHHLTPSSIHAQPPQRIFSPAELSLYNGRDKSKPVYVSVKGDVFDVTQGRRIYGPGGPYDFFAGRDASRAYTTGCFKVLDGHLTHDTRGLSREEHRVSAASDQAHRCLR